MTRSSAIVGLALSVLFALSQACVTDPTHMGDSMGGEPFAITQISVGAGESCNLSDGDSSGGAGGCATFTDTLVLSNATCGGTPVSEAWPAGAALVIQGPAVVDLGSSKVTLTEISGVAPVSINSSGQITFTFQLASDTEIPDAQEVLSMQVPVSFTGVPAFAGQSFVLTVGNTWWDVGANDAHRLIFDNATISPVASGATVPSCEGDPCLDGSLVTACSTYYCSDGVTMTPPLMCASICPTPEQQQAWCSGSVGAN